MQPSENALACNLNVFDAQHQASPVEVADTKSDQKPNDPHGIEFNYSSGTAGTVSVQFFSYAPSAVSVSLTDGGLVSTSGATTPLTLSA